MTDSGPAWAADNGRRLTRGLGLGRWLGLRVGRAFNRLLAVGEASHEPSRQAADDEEDDERGDHLVHRVGQKALLERGLVEAVAAGPGRRDQRVGSASGDAAVDDRRDRRGNDGRGDSGYQSGAYRVYRADLTAKEDRPGHESQIHEHHESEEDPRLVDVRRRAVREARELFRAGIGAAVRVERERRNQDDGDDRARDADDVTLARSEQAELPPQAGEETDNTGGDRERADRGGADRSRDDVSPDEVGENTGKGAGEWSGQNSDEDRADRIEVDRELEPLLHRRPEHDVDGDGDGHPDDDPGRELASYPALKQIHLP